MARYIYGSERILGLARTLEREYGYPDKFVSRLRNIGVPTIFKVRLPVSQFTDYEIEAIVKEIATFWVKNKLSPNDIHEIDYCYLVYGDIEGSNLLGHKHPERIQCPYTHIVYKTRLPNANDEIQGHA